MRAFTFSPDSAVAIDRKRKAKPFRSKVDGFYSEGSIRSKSSNRSKRFERLKRVERFEPRRSAPGFRLAPGSFGLTAESVLLHLPTRCLRF
jgi:hypothetical protein